MRFAAYAGTSMVLATGVIIRALHERANFYSACVYLAQSNACLMVLTNIALLGVCTGMFALQKLFFGALRPIEIEQLYEKAWFAITETCLAMTIFREEVGGWFFVMFVCLLIGKVWGWIGDGRVEILEQQPPSNPRLFHARLSVSLIISSLFDILLLRYSINTVLRHARPNMMVMFAFEFAVLTVTSISTAARYTISLHEANVIKTQIKDRQRQMKRERELSISRTAATDDVASPESAPNDANTDDDIESVEIDVPGWEEKGRWVFYLDLTTDFFKLILYLTFFCVLCMFYGMPIHIIRDVALTIRSFYKRITDFVRYRQATRDMNSRYPDATSEEIAREDVCIICREDMRPWRQENSPDTQQANDVGSNNTTRPSVDERLRPKKLPCGHILHFACLRSWLERQQNCPTCRRSVLTTGNVAHGQEPALANQPGRGPGQLHRPQPQVPAQGNLQQPVAAQNVFNLGPFRIAFGARHGVPGPQPQPYNQTPPQLAQPGPSSTAGQLPRSSNSAGLQHQTPGWQTRTVANFSPSNMQLQLYQIEQHLVREINGLRLQHNQLNLVRALQSELARLRMTQTGTESVTGGPPSITGRPRFVEALPQTGQSFSSIAQQNSMGHGHPNLPAGVTVPPGWTILPLQRLPGQTSVDANETDSAGTTNPLSQVPNTDPSVESTTNYFRSPSHVTLRQATSTPRGGGSLNLPESGHSQGPIDLQTASVDPTSMPGVDLDSSAENSVPLPAQNECANAESSTHMKSQQHVPNWASSGQLSGPSVSAHDEAGDSTFKALPGCGDTPSDEGAVSQTPTDSGQVKGKAKASTVEDAAEDSY